MKKIPNFRDKASADPYLGVRVQKPTLFTVVGTVIDQGVYKIKVKVEYPGSGPDKCILLDEEDAETLFGKQRSSR